MKTRRSSLFAFCILSSLALLACTPEEENSTKSCNATSECGSAEEWRCNVEENICIERNPAHCKNSVKDEGESDVNCGGTCEYKCEVGKSCAKDDDCGTGYCSEEKVCAIKPCTNASDCQTKDPTAVCDFGEVTEATVTGICVSCFDEIKNGTELDVDCGGNCVAKCQRGQNCLEDTDCITGQCTSGVCAGDAPNAPNASDLVINEVMSNASTSKAFDNIEDSKQCDFVEIVNVSDHSVSLDGVILKTKRTGEKEEEASYALSGSLHSKQAAVVNACADNYFPSDVVHLSGFDPKFNLVNTAEGYSISLHIGDIEAAKVNFAASTAGSSFNLSKDLDVSNPTLVLHNTVNADLNNSPGRCSNNQPFSTGCIDPCANGVKDGDETDIDCGGSCNKCVNDKFCKINADCLTGSCESGKCAGEMPQTPVAGDLVINEVMPAANKGASFDNFTTSEQCDFAEIVNNSNKLVTLDGINLVLTRTDKETKPASYPLSGNLKPKGVALIHACSSDPFPKDVLSIYHEKFDFTNSGLNYTISLTSGETALATVTYVTDKERKGVSLNLPTDLSTDSTEMSYHSEISEFKHTPGRCLNNGTFASGCFDSCSTGVKDGDESDVDCGGSCAGCELDKACTKATDCDSNYCDENGTCAVEPCKSNTDCGEGQTCTNEVCVDKCANGVKDSDEADVDCGGSCELCPNGANCNNANECINGECNSGTCAGTPCEAPLKGELVINEVLGYLPKQATAMNYSNNDQIEFIELYNKSSKRIDLKNLAIDLVKQENNTTKTVKVEGITCLAPDHYLVLSSKELTLKGPNAVSVQATNVGFTDKEAYDLKLYNTVTSDTIHEAIMPECQECKNAECTEFKNCTDDSRGVSYARTGGFYDDDTTKITLTRHDQLTYYDKLVTDTHSPGVDNFTSVTP